MYDIRTRSVGKRCRNILSPQSEQSDTVIVTKPGIVYPHMIYAIRHCFLLVVSGIL